jgi:hypothetical protein
MFLGSRAWPTRKAESLIAICEPIVWTMWDPAPSTTEELLGRKSSGSGLEIREYDCRDPSRYHATPL